MTKLKIAALCFSGVFLSACGSPGIEFEAPRPTLRLQEVTAVRTTLGGGEDQVYFRLSDGSRVPNDYHTIRAGETWTPVIALDATTSGSIELYEADTITGDDLIGTFNYNRTEVGTYTQTMTGDGSHYELTWVVRIE